MRNKQVFLVLSSLLLGGFILFLSSNFQYIKAACDPVSAVGCQCSDGNNWNCGPFASCSCNTSPCIGTCVAPASSDCPDECRKTRCGTGYINAAGCSGSGPNFGCKSTQACCKAKSCGGGGGGGGCSTSAPLNVSITSTSVTSSTVTWTPGAAGTSQAIYVGADQTKVASFCPSGVGSGTGCVILNSALPASQNSYATGNVLSTGTVYYYKISNNSSCGSASATSNSISSCTISPSSVTLDVGATAILTSLVNASVDITQVTYISSAPLRATVTSPDVTYPYTTTVTGISAGAATVTNNVYLGAVLNCSDTASVTVTDPFIAAWWQVKDSDVSAGTLNSLVPSGSYFDIVGDGGYPGVPAYSISSNITANNASLVGWQAQSAESKPKVFDYQYFSNQIPADTLVTTLSSNVLDQAGIDGNTTPSHGFYWYKYSGVANGLDLDVTTALSIGSKKVILLVDSANFNIGARINLTKGRGFFMVIVGKDSSGAKGNISVNPAVGGAAYDLEGLYVADSEFSSGVAAISLKVRGSVVAYDGVNLQRDLGTPANANPAEFFEYAPDQILLFPSVLGVRKINWKEVAP